MNPSDPNQPQEPTPTPEPAQTPEMAAEPAFVPAPGVATPIDGTPAPLVEPVVTQAPVPNPFGGAPVSSDPAVAPQFAQPTSTIGSTPNSNPTPNLLGDAKKKKLIIMLAAIVGGLVVLGVIAFVVIGFLFPSKQDYRSASVQFNAVSAAYSDLSSNASKLQYDISGSTTETEFTNDSEAVTKSVQSFQDANKKLSGMKAIKAGDGKTLYSAYDGKVTSFVTYANDMFASVKSFRPVAKACDNPKTVTLLNECVTAVNGIGDVPNADLKQYVTAIQTQYKAYLSIVTQVAAISDPYGKQYSQYSALRDQGYDIQKKISSASTDLRSNLSKHSDEVDPAVAANALGEFLVKKANN